jgi:hypothetical protein
MRRRFLSLALASLLATSACTSLARFAAGPPHARARQTQLTTDGTGQVHAIALEVDLYNPNIVDLRATRFDFVLESGAASVKGSVAAPAISLPPEAWSRVPLLVPLEGAPEVRAAIAAGQPYVITGSLALDGGTTGLAVGVSGEGVLGREQAVVRVAAKRLEGGAL